MKTITITKTQGLQYLRFCFSILLSSLLFVAQKATAQNGTLCYTPMTGFGKTATAIQSGGPCLACTFADSASNITDANTNNYANFNTAIGLAAGNGVTVVDSVNTYPAGYEAGYVVDLGNGVLTANILSSFTIETYNNGTLAESKNISNGLSVSALSGTSGKVHLNFKTTLPFNEVRFTFNSVVGGFSQFHIYYAMAFDSNCGNSFTATYCYKQLAGNQTAINFNGGLLNALVTLTNPGNITDGNKTTYGTLTVPAATPLLSAPVFVGVTDLQNVYPAGNKAGFMIGFPASLLTANVLNSLSIVTYLHGQQQDSVNLGSASGTGITIAALATGDTSEKEVSITTTKPFNEVRLVTDNTLGVNVGSINIYYAFESGAACTDCKQVLTSNQSAPYTGAVVAGRTGLQGVVCIGQSQSGTANLVDASLTNFASYTPAILSVGCSGRMSVSNGSGGTFPANTFAGFALSRQGTLLDLGILGAVTINLYNAGTLVQSGNGNSLLGTSLLNPVTGMTTVGIKATVPFNEVQIVFDAGLINASLGGTYSIYYAYVVRDDDGDGVADCNEVCGLTKNDAIDSDGDGVPDACDACTATTTLKLSTRDSDGDGISDACDQDSDNDGIADVREDANHDGDPTNDDADGDGIPNYLDLDSDNDGILDLYESGIAAATLTTLDANHDGIIDGTVAVGTNGLADVLEASDAATSDNNYTLANADGDSVGDFIDLDSDNDGITDLKESGRTLTDANGDGVVDGPDTDLDGIRDSADGNNSARGAATLPALKDTDGDGVADFRDLDSDNDGINDIKESGKTYTDANNDGMADNADVDGDGIMDSVDLRLRGFGDATSTLKDTDGDGVADFRDLDSDNDGINDVKESGLALTADANGDGMVDGTDTDGDGIIGVADGNTSVYGDANDITVKDTDGDGVPDFRDLDSDNDGINDVKESGLVLTADANGDGMVDGTDTDGDGIIGVADGNTSVYGDANDITVKDTDGDGVPDFRDLDSDNDGINDVKESGLPLTADANGDGMVDGTDTDGDGIIGVADGNTSVYGDASDITLRDTDGDGVPDVRDLDSDNDGINDVKESGLPLTADANGDGMVDGTDTDGDGIIGVADGNTSLYGDAADITLKDTDGDGIPDARDLDSDNDGINDVRESGLPLTADADNNGMVDGTDTDGDGIIGVADGNTAVYGDANDITFRDTDGDGIPDARDLDSDNDGISDLIESGITGYTDADKDGVVDGPDTDGDGIQDSVDGLPAAFGDAGDPLPQDTDSDGAPNFTDSDSNNDGINDITSTGLGYLDPNGDGKVDNPTDPDGDGIPNNDGLDFKPTTFGGLGPVTTINVTALLQGALWGNGGGTVMRDNLRQNSTIPLTQPYSNVAGARFKQVGGGEETTNSTVLNANAGTNNAIVDWVLLEFRSSTKADSIVHTVSALIKRNGQIVGADGNQLGVVLPVGTYYIAVKHRNHLGVMSSSPAIISGQANTFNFTNGATYGTGAQVQVSPGVYAMWGGDVNHDGMIYFTAPGNDRDAQLVLLSGNQFGYVTTYQYCDINMDGQAYFTAPGNDRDLLLANPMSGSEFGFIQEQLP